MPDNEPEPQPIQGEIPEPGPLVNVPLVYVNWIRGVPGPFDLAIDMGYWLPGNTPEAGIRVAMTWEHAKMLQHLMNSVITQREKNAGTIELPPGIRLTPIPGEDDDESNEGED